MNENLQLDNDFTHESYGGQESNPPPPSISGGTAISSFNGLSGPSVSLDGGSTGYAFTTAAPNITLTVSDPAIVRSSISAAKSGVNTDITELTGASQVDVSGVYKKSGTQVVGARKTGWATATGTANRTTFATYAGQTVSATPTQAEVQAIDDHVKILSQRLKALIDDLHATAGHGLIGT